MGTWFERWEHVLTVCKCPKVEIRNFQNAFPSQKMMKWAKPGTISSSHGSLWPLLSSLMNFLMGNKPNSQYFWGTLVSFHGSKQLSKGTNLNKSDANLNHASFQLATMAMFIKFLIRFSFSPSQDPEGSLLVRVAKLTEFFVIL